MTRRSDESADARAREAAELLAEMRADVEAATRQLDELSSELAAHRARVDELESVVDVLLGTTDTVVLVIDHDNNITGTSRGSVERLDGAAVGKPLSAVLPAPVVDQLGHALASGPRREIDVPVAGLGIRVNPLPLGGAVLVLSGT